MWHVQVIWDDEENPDGNVQHIAQHGLTIEDVEYVLESATEEVDSRSSDRQCCFGYTPSGDYIIVVYEKVNDDSIYPVTAYEVPEP
jgi:uncharacterized DUF497 family protein